MLIAQKLRKENIAEYLLYMWQVEDIIRAYGCNLQQIKKEYISRFDCTDEQKEEMVDWYGNLIRMINQEGCREKGHIQISIDNARSLVKGTPLNDRLYSFIQKKLSLDDRAYELERRESQMIMDGKSLEDIDIELTKERQKLSEELNTLAKSFILSNCDNILGPGVFRMICGGYDIPIVTPLIEDIMKEAPDNFKNHPMVKVYMEIAEQNLELMKKEMSR